MDIQHFISLIRKYKNPTEVSDLMFTELIDKIVVYEAEGVGKDVYKRQEQFEQLLRADRRNAYYTEFLPIDPDKADQDLRDVLAHGLMDEANKKQIFTLLQSGRSNSEILSLIHI